jgi:probable F420-dependent oxidoreductase
MRFGYLSHNHAGGIRPDDLARELEARRFDSLWVGEHTHIPVGSDARRVEYPGGGPMPDSAWSTMDPFVSLAIAAGASTDLVLATGVCLPLEHDLLDLACTVASLDVLARGRLLLGIGFGWHPDEHTQHRPDIPFAQRHQAVRERVRALRAAWAGDGAEFHGTWDRFERSIIRPQPVGGAVPIALGGAGPIGMRHAAEYADEWCPVDVALVDSAGRRDVGAAIVRFHELAAELGRDPATIPITLVMWARPTRERIDRYAALGVARLVFAPESPSVHGADATLAHLDRLAEVVDTY